MIQVRYKGMLYECSTAIKGTRYVHLLDAGGYMVAQFNNITDFTDFTISGGTWSIPTDAYDYYVGLMGDKCITRIGSSMCWSNESFEYFQKFIDKQILGASDRHYVYTQSVASDTWVVEHNLDKHPAVTVVDSAGSEVVGEVTHIDSNTTQIYFSAAFSGKAYFN